MDRLPKLLIAAAVVVLAPLPAAAQGWPATVVAGAPQMTAQNRLPLTVDRQTYAHRPQGAPVDPAPAGRPRLKLSPTPEWGETPEVDIPARDEWTDDEGFRVSPTRLAFKRRF